MAAKKEEGNMKNILTIIACLAVVFLLGRQPAQAQDFGALLSAVEKIETDLKALVEGESAERAKAIASLRAELAQIEQPASTVDAATISGLRADMAGIKQQLARLSAMGTKSEDGSSDILSLINEIEYLKAEVTSLKAGANKSDRRLASTGPEGLAIAFGDQSASNDDPGDLFGELEISGFFDVIGTHQTATEDETEFGLGQAEVDIESQLSERASIAMAVAYNSDESTFELGCAELGLNVYANDETFVSSIDVIAGQFDVPFGIDYNVYPSIDRKLITAPLAVDHTHGGWNDFGVKYQMESEFGNFVGYWVNGFESSAEVLDEALTLSLGYDVFEEINTTPATAFGARVGITPTPNLEFGGSFASGLNESSRSEMTLIGADAQVNLADFQFKGEYISHSLNRSIAPETNSGYYAQAMYNFNPIYVVGRYGSFKPEDVDWVGQGSLGVGYAIAESIELRFETVINKDSDENANVLQMAVGF
jgi:hypothetical protein